MKFKFILTIIVISLLLLASCSDKKTTQPAETAPTVPPQSSMVINFNQFPDSSNLQKTEFSRSNWGYAALNVTVWNSVLTLTLAVPVAAFLESFNHQPVLQPDGSWLWAYDVNVSGIVYHAKLYGSTEQDGIHWRMLLSKDGAYTDFEWFTGLSNLPATEGSWMLNKEPNDPSEFLSIVWHRNAQDSTGDIKYTNVQTQGYIFYSKTDESLYNAFYQIFNPQNNNENDIRWNIENWNGGVKDNLYFGDAAWHCWDENLMDIDCP